MTAPARTPTPVSDIALVRPTGAPPPPARRISHRLARARAYAALFRTSCHARLALANLACGVLPDVASGAHEAPREAE